jgi:hypothetical protein
MFRFELTTPGELNAAAVPVEVNGVQRYLSSAVLSMAVRFNNDPRAHAEAGHDCEVFARACDTGNSYDGQTPRYTDGPLRNASYKKAKVAGMTEPDIPAGQSLKMESRGPGGKLLQGAHHFIVRASVDGISPPLYVSKQMAEGEVLLHDFEAAQVVYPATDLSRITAWRDGKASV